jgi:PAS domain S-box-containing protein
MDINWFKQLFSKKDKTVQLHEDEKLNLALRSSGAGLWSWDITQDIITWDKQTPQLFGLHSSSYPKNYAEFLNLIYPEDRARIKDLIQQLLNKNTDFEMDFRVEFPDKSIHYIGTKAKIHFDQSNKPILMTGVCWDMTHRREIEEELKHAKQAAEEASRSKTNFMAKISHDLRSPLNGIIGFAELIYHGKVGPTPPDQKEYLGDILTSARHLLLLINDVLDIAKVESGKMEFFPEPTDLNKILSETKDIFQMLIQEKNMQVEMYVDPALKNVLIDPGRLKQVIYNFVSNALKCTAEHGKVSIRIVPHGANRLRLEVEDNGIGIRKEDLNRLFVEFQQLDSKVAKKYPSSGLGLALTKHIVEAQGGSVGVESTFGKGSTFFAILPCSFN